jgi:hypothetical protein
MKRLSLKALLVGGISDVVATNVLVFLVVVFVAAALAFTHVPKDQVAPAVAIALREGPMSALLIFIGSMCVLIGIFGVFLQHDLAQILHQLALEVSAPLLGFFGGYLWVLQSRRNATPSDAFRSS